MTRRTWTSISTLATMLLGLLVAPGCATLSGRSPADAAFGARKRLVRELVARGEWNEAFAHAMELYRQRPDDAEVLTLRGTIFRERKLLDEAEADLRAAVARNPGSAEAHAALAVLLDARGQGQQAEGQHRKAVALDGSNAGYLNNLGFSLLVRRQTREALEVLQRSVRIDPTNRRVRTNLGFAYAASGDLPRAAREFDLGAPPAESRNNLGFAYESRGDLTNAFQLYAEALRLDPGCAHARGNLTHVAGKLGRPIPPELNPSTAPRTAPSMAPESPEEIAP